MRLNERHQNSIFKFSTQDSQTKKKLLLNLKRKKNT